MFRVISAFGLFLVAVSSYAANIAVIDSGVDYKHQDLSSKMWSNPNSKTVDADGTTYQNDTRGWNFAEKNNEIIDYKYLNTFSADCYKIFEVQGKILGGTATDEEKAWYTQKKGDQTFLKELQKFGNFVHGTHVSGISSGGEAKAKIIGMKLIPTERPGAKYMAQIEQFMRDNMNTDDTATNPLAKMFLGMVAKQQAQLLTTVGKYVAATKSDVANGSFGISVTSVSPTVAGMLKQFIGHEPSKEEIHDYSVYLVDQISIESKTFVGAAPGTLFVFAAGNDGSDNDKEPVSPANIKADNTIAVAATQGNSKLATFSCYGSSKVEVAAPGVAVKSSIPGNVAYLPMSGTSMAAPFVTNVAGAVKDAHSAFGPAEIKKVMMETVDVKDFLAGKVKTSGIVNKERAVRAAQLANSMALEVAIAQARYEIADEPSFLDSFEELSAPLVLPLPSPF